jgi:hypothetical protein
VIVRAWDIAEKRSIVLHSEHSKARTSKPGDDGSMQASLIGLRHLEQARIPISARLYSGLGWADGTMLALDQAGALSSLSPITIDKER